MYKKILLALLVGLFLSSPFLTLAQFKAQQSYPNIGGNELVSDTASESIPKLVIYIFNLIVWLCILVAILVLILGGIQYVSSSGDVSKMSSAKTRIYSSLLGLLILIGTWFVLHTINPTIVIPKITYKPLKSGIFLFTDYGYKKFLNKSSDESVINDLLQSQEAFYLSNSTPDLTKEFGELVVYERNQQNEASMLNFENFQIAAIGFWGKKDAQSIVVAYPQKGYKGTNSYIRYYSTKGQVNENNEIVDGDGNVAATSKFDMQIVVLKMVTEKDVEYFDVDKYVPNPNNAGEETVNDDLIYPDKRDDLLFVKSTTEKHSPLSLKIIRNAPGVYLYAQNGDNRYFDASAVNFKSADINFDQMAQGIKIINDVEYEYIDLDGKPQVEKESRDFLAILHENDNFSGNLKIYFEQRQYNISNLSNIHANPLKGKGKKIPAYNTCGMPITEEEMTKDEMIGVAFLITGNEKGAVANDKLSKFISNTKNTAGFYEWKAYNFGHLPMVSFDDTARPPQEKKAINLPANSGYSAYKVYEEDRYGIISEGKSISSLQMYELAEDPSVCQEVRLCTEKSGRGYCLAYVASDNQSSQQENNTIFYPMPVYLPVPIPKDGSIFDACSIKPLPVVSDGGKDVEVNFQGNIKSVVIKGKCAVVLFGGAVTNRNTALSMVVNITNYLYRLSVAGSKSEVFTSSDYNLEDNQIGLCGSSVGFGRWFSKSCAVGIAVYPIK